MRPVVGATDAQFQAAILTSQQLVTRCDLLLAGTPQPNGEGAAHITAGSITADRRRERLTDLAATVVLPERIPGAVGDTFAPTGYELRVWRGVQIAGTPALVALGTFPIQSSMMSARRRETSLRCADRSQIVSDEPFVDDRQIGANSNVVATIVMLIAEAAPWIPNAFPSLPDVTPLLTFSSSTDRWSACRQLAASIGYELYFDGLGTVRMRLEPTFGMDPAIAFTAATNVIDASVGLNRESAYKRVVVASRNASNGALYRGEAISADYDGPFGRKTMPLNHPEVASVAPFIASSVQATAAATAILARFEGLPKSVSAVTVPDPRAEPSDVALIEVPSLGVSEVHILEAQTIGLGPTDAMPIETRERRI